VLDFGLARREPQPGVDPVEEKEGLIGTAVYMAPEQIMGQPAAPAPTIFALGALMHEMLSARGRSGA